ncbi:transcriptional regulator, MerR family [Deinococcus aerius]|uniref:Transcriptional regulator, MerR family n=1 Tax=Deinococcus aerius TaxID=200253 RepID=A0A2I9DTY3_9DEIO|nr:MerR family transcriptional regulator [Deinococcus aerius]GBF06137.1 transcriptional regulator, MerR family [Deinococcus aerius]
MYRTVDLARASGLSVQGVRQYEHWGFLPPVDRTASGQRRYEGRHLDALLTARVLRGGYSWKIALQVMRAVHAGDLVGALREADRRHAGLHRRRGEVLATIEALNVTSRAAPARLRLPRGRPSALRVGEAARHVGEKVSTLHYWETRGLVVPLRDPRTGYRLYDAPRLRQVEIVALLRRAGYDFASVRRVLDEVSTGRLENVLGAAQARLTQLDEDTRKCVAATAALWAYLEWHGGPEAGPVLGKT